MDIKRFDLSPTGSRLVIANGVAYFTGHCSPYAETLAEQTAGVCKRYDELFAQFGLKKADILYASAYLKDITREPEFAGEFQKWIGDKDKPSGVTVHAMPVQNSPLGDNIQVELALIVAADGEEIQRMDNGRFVIHNGLAYFTGHVYPKADDIQGQTAGVLARYDELFEQFGLKKENIVAANGFLMTIDDYAGTADAWNAYFGDKPPAGVMVEASPYQGGDIGDNLRLELAFFVATDDSKPIKRIDVVPGMARVVEYNGFAYFTGHSAKPGHKTLKEQATVLMERFDELFDQLGYKKENIVMINAYLKDINQLADFDDIFHAWRHPDHPPAGVAVQAAAAGAENQLEVQFIVAIDN